MEQTMENKNTKTNSKMIQKMKSIRINSENQKRLEKVILLANKKKIGRKIKVDQVLSLALDLVNEEHIKKMQGQSLSNEDKKELLRQKWSETYGAITKDEFTGVMLTKEFSDFLSATNINELSQQRTI